MAVGAPMRVGLVGCGNISDIYLQNGPRFRDIVFTACADLSAEAASRQAARYALQARSVEDLLKSDDVDIVLNLTIPEAHAGVSLEALEAGKHVYSEKPLATAVADGVAILAAAKAKGLRVGAAPDTVLGAGVQEARALIDAGAHRQGTDRSCRRDVARHGALASQSRFLLPPRRWASLRHGSGLSVCARHAARTGRFRPGGGPDRLRGTRRDDAHFSGAGRIRSRSRLSPTCTPYLISPPARTSLSWRAGTFASMAFRRSNCMAKRRRFGSPTLIGSAGMF